MRKTASVLITVSVALILAWVFTEMRTSKVSAKPEESGAIGVETGPSVSLTPAPQQGNVGFLWILPSEESRYPTYKRVEGGKHQDGTMMYICRFFSIPGKVYKDNCMYPDGGDEWVRDTGYTVLVSDVDYEWKGSKSVSRAQIKDRAVMGGLDPHNRKDPFYICRKKMNDGVHPGKYSYTNNLCYIPWGGKEYSYATGFDVLFFPKPSAGYPK